MKNSSVVVSRLFGGEITILERDRLPWHRFGALLLWTDLADMRNPFLCFLGSLDLGGLLRNSMTC